MNQNNPFGNIDTSNLESQGDRLGGGGILDSGVYAGVISAAYAGESKGGAKSMTFHVKLDNGRDYRETFYVTSGREKGQKYYYEKDGKQYPMPGFTQSNDIALLASGKALTEQTFEEKIIKLYDFDAKAEVPSKVQMATSLLGLRIKLGVLKEIVDKNVDSGGGVYVPSGETREQNTLDKVFHDASGQTVSELTQSRDVNAAGEFITKWTEKHQGQTRNKAKGAGGNAGAPGRPAPTSNTPAPNKGSLFGG